MFLWPVLLSLVLGKQDTFHSCKDLTTSLCCLSLKETMALTKTKYLNWGGLEKGVTFQRVFHLLFILKWGKEHDGGEFGEQRQTEILSLLTKGKRRQTKPAGESLMFWKALWKWKPKVCIKADLKELHSRSRTTCLLPPRSRITAFQMGLEHITCCFCTRYVLILHIYCPVFVLLWLTCDSVSEHHAAPAAKQIL